MEERKFKIVGEVENIDLPSEEEDNKKSEGKFEMRIDPNMLEKLLEDLRNSGNSLPPPSDKEVEDLMKKTGMSLGDATKMFSDFEKMIMSQLNLSSQEEEESLLDNLFNNISKNSGNLESETKKPSALDYGVLLVTDTYGVVIYERNTNILADFKRRYGNKERYEMKDFSPKIKVSNAILGMDDIEYLDYVSNNEKYILFRAIPGNENLEPFYIAFIQLAGDFEMVVPDYGNSFDIETAMIFNKEEDVDSFRETPMGFVLKRPANLQKINTGLDLALFQNKRPLLNVMDFGKVITAFEKENFSSDTIKVGKIVSNELNDAILFKADFNLREDQLSFDFYVKLSKTVSAKTLNNIIEYLRNIDFNTNTKIQTCELKVSGKETIYIDIDLGDLPDFIDTWKDE